MGPDIDGDVKLVEMLVPTVPSGTAGATNGAAVDLLGYGGRGILLASALSAGTGNTMKIELQTDSASAFNVAAVGVKLYPVGSMTNADGTTAGVDSFTTATATAMLSTYAFDINACKRYIRCIYTSAGTSIVGAVHAVCALPGHRVKGPSGPGTTS